MSLSEKIDGRSLNTAALWVYRAALGAVLAWGVSHFQDRAERLDAAIEKIIRLQTLVQIHMEHEGAHRAEMEKRIEYLERRDVGGP